MANKFSFSDESASFPVYKSAVFGQNSKKKFVVCVLFFICFTETELYICVMSSQCCYKHFALLLTTYLLH